MTSMHLTNAWHAESGGIRTFYRAMLATANRLQRRMVVVVPSDADDVEEVGTWGCVRHVRAPRVPFGDRRYRVLLPHLFLQRDGALRKMLGEEQPCVVEINDKYALPFFAGWIRRHLPGDLARPTIVGLSCERADDWLAAQGWPLRGLASLAGAYIRRVYLPQCDYHLANSAYTAAELRTQSRAHPREVFEVPMGVDAESFGACHRSPEVRRLWAAALALPPTAPLILYAGRLAPEKRLTTAIDAVAVVRRCGLPAGLVLVGDGPDRPRLRRHAQRVAPGAVLFMGHLEDRAALARAYASADAFLHVNPREPFGIGPLEAMASFVPVVLPDTAGVRSYATSANAWLAAPDPEALAGAVLDAVRVPDRARLQAARQTAERHDWRASTQRVFEMYDQLHDRRSTTDRARWPAPRAHRSAVAGA